MIVWNVFRCCVKINPEFIYSDVAISKSHSDPSYKVFFHKITTPIFPKDAIMKTPIEKYLPPYAKLLLPQIPCVKFTHKYHAQNPT